MSRRSRASARFTRLRVNSFILVAALLLSGFGSCTRQQLTALCDGELPRYVASFENAQIALQPWVAQGRNPASHLDSGPKELAPIDRAGWQRWAEDKLRKTQLYHDQALDTPELRPVRLELSTLLNELVTFHGYAVQGRAASMSGMLGRLHERSDKIRQLACEQALAQR